jgi:hypothetical protein
MCLGITKLPDKNVSDEARTHIVAAQKKAVP